MVVAVVVVVIKMLMIFYTKRKNLYLHGKVHEHGLGIEIMGMYGLYCLVSVQESGVRLRIGLVIAAVAGFVRVHEVRICTLQRIFLGPVVVLAVQISNVIIEAPSSGEHFRGVMSEIPLSNRVRLVACTQLHTYKQQ